MITLLGRDIAVESNTLTRLFGCLMSARKAYQFTEITSERIITRVVFLPIIVMGVRQVLTVIIFMLVTLVPLGLAKAIVILGLVETVVTCGLAETIVTLGLVETIVILGLVETLVTLGLVETLVTLGLVVTLVTCGLAETIVTLGLAETIVTLGLVETLVTLGLAEHQQRQLHHIRGTSNLATECQISLLIVR